MAESKDLFKNKRSPSQQQNDNGFDELQNQLDAFMEKEKEGISSARQQAGELQQRLDSFIDNLQGQLDSYLKEQPSQAPDVPFSDEKPSTGNAPQTAASISPPTHSSEPLASDASLSDPVLQAGALFPDQSDAPTQVEKYADGGHKILLRLLIGVGGLIASLAWVVWDKNLLHEFGQSRNAAPVLSADNRSGQGDQNRTKPASVNRPDSGAEKQSLQALPDIDTAPASHQPTRLQAAIQVNRRPVQANAEKRAAQQTLQVKVAVGNVRSAPTLQARVLHKLKQGAIVTKLDERDGWYRIRLRNGEIAWAFHTIF